MTPPAFTLSLYLASSPLRTPLEGVIAAAADGVSDWLPGATIGALATGGNTSIAYGTALALGATYAGAALVATLVTSTRRDVSE